MLQSYFVLARASARAPARSLAKNTLAPYRPLHVHFVYNVETQKRHENSVHAANRLIIIIIVTWIARIHTEFSEMEKKWNRNTIRYISRVKMQKKNHFEHTL